MMNLFKPFRVRSASRDADTDKLRFDRLIATVETLREELVREREGLHRRFAESSRDAGFTEQALDEEPRDTKLAERLDKHTETILQAEARLQVLEDQADFLKRISDQITEFWTPRMMR